MSGQAETEVRKAISGARPFFHEDDLPEILGRLENVLREGRLIFGSNTREFEEAFRRYVGTAHAVSVNSCTTALEITLRFFDVREREVIVPTNTFASVVKAIIYAGGIPVLADMDAQTFCVDTEDLLKRISPRTAGIIVVHIAGLIYPQTAQLHALCRQKNLFLIEDVSHAHGASVDNRKGGSLADAGCFSFYPTKIMTTGTGGMITTDNARLADYARSLRHHGQGESLENIVNLGNDWLMNEMSAVLGLYQLKRLDENVAHRRRVAEWYREDLSGCDWLSIPEYDASLLHAYYKFPVMLGEGLDKESLRRLLRDEFKIEVGTIYDPPCHLQPVFQKQLGCYEGMFPNAERTLRQQICLPIHALITRDEVTTVVSSLRQIVEKKMARS